MASKKCPCGCGRDVDPATGLLFADDSCLTRVLGMAQQILDDPQNADEAKQVFVAIAAAKREPIESGDEADDAAIPVGLPMPTADDFKDIADFGLTVEEAALNVSAIMRSISDEKWQNLMNGEFMDQLVNNPDENDENRISVFFDGTIGFDAHLSADALNAILSDKSLEFVFDDPLINRRVNTPKGEGRLLYKEHDRCIVKMRRTQRYEVFDYKEISLI